MHIRTAVTKRVLPRFRECSRQVEAEVVSNSTNKIYQTWKALFWRSLQAACPLFQACAPWYTLALWPFSSLKSHVTCCEGGCVDSVQYRDTKRVPMGGYVGRGNPKSHKYRCTWPQKWFAKHVVKKDPGRAKLNSHRTTCELFFRALYVLGRVLI